MDKLFSLINYLSYLDSLQERGHLTYILYGSSIY